MLYENIGEWVKNIEDAGIKKGLAQGGTQMLLLLLEQKFGSLPSGVRREIEAASPKTIRQWGTRLLEAQSLDQVLNGNGDVVRQ